MEKNLVRERFSEIRDERLWVVNGVEEACAAESTAGGCLSFVTRLIAQECCLEGEGIVNILVLLFVCDQCNPDADK